MRKFVFVRVGTKHPFEEECGVSEDMTGGDGGARGVGVVTVEVVPGGVGGVGVEERLITYRTWTRVSREEP